MKAALETDFTKSCGVCFEHSVCVGGYTYLMIYGHHINGGFICIPNWNICCEASTHPYSIEYNAKQMEAAGLDYHVAKELAAYIDDFLIRRG